MLTPTDVRALLDEHGLRPSRALGQNFLADPNTAERIARIARVGAGDRVVEIGPGLGSLSLALAATGCDVLAVELDRHLVPVLRSVVEDKDRVAIVTGAARGIGQAYGLALAREGAKVIAADILSCGETIAKIQSKTMWNNLFIGHRVSVGALGNAGWSCTLFASYSQWIVGPFAMSVSQEPCVFAMIVGWEIRLFASPSLTVRKPLQVSTDTIVE